MSRQLLVTFNAGSSTVKIGLFAIEGGGLTRVGKGMIDFRKAPLRFELSEGPDRFDVELEAKAEEELDEVLREAFDRLSWHYDLSGIAAIGHRVVHGGDLFDGPVLINDQAMSQMEALIPLAPLHQPQALRLVRAIARLRPEIRQTASFDTAFHRTHAEVVRRFALPRRLYEEGIKRYGFHGLSYRSIADQLLKNWPEQASGKVVVAHLGSGASLCAMDNCVSRDTSMGFSTLDGVPMATRCGALDAGVVIHLLKAGRDPDEIEDLLYHRSGLLGVSGISADSRVLLESDEGQAKEAIELFTFRIAGEIARLGTTLGGLDTLVFTAGIGEHQPAIRADICTRLMWLGIDLDPEANADNRTVISSPASRLTVLVIPTDEEQVIATEALRIAGG
ncbi:acetate/propionate family kinase [Shinella sumterensis]|uniref:Acetate kinase n=1 Tax=Rhizobium subbaraonis TaxID=908946 RepID=A0A285V1S4_9HYPH|nr:acetate/propionate family kinase [Rhizobium subbaraonis]WLS06978.1 acetate/propionate family kinase [Shinella sumterensis]SOC47887.1 acetate kinase [Rhizobium subbaraonis]